MSFITDPTDGKPGLRIETAASVTARDMFTSHINAFKFAIKSDRAAAQATVSAYIEGLTGVMALAIAGGHGSRDEVVRLTTERLAKDVDQLLRLMKRT